MRRVIFALMLAAAFLAPSTVLAQPPALPPSPAQPVQSAADLVAEVRIHGNYATPDAAVLALADLTIGQPLAGRRNRSRRGAVAAQRQVRVG